MKFWELCLLWGGYTLGNFCGYLIHDNFTHFLIYESGAVALFMVLFYCTLSKVTKVPKAPKVIKYKIPDVLKAKSEYPEYEPYPEYQTHQWIDNITRRI